MDKPTLAFLALRYRMIAGGRTLGSCRRRGRHGTGVSIMLRMSKHKVWALIAGAVSLIVVSSTMAEQKVPIKLAVQTTIGPSDAPVRTAVFTPADRQRTK